MAARLISDDESEDILYDPVIKGHKGVESVDPKPKRVKQYVVRNLILQLFFFVYCFYCGLVKNCDQDLLYEGAHLDNQTQNESNNNITEYMDSPEAVADNYRLYSKLVELVPSVILLFVLGPWSDKHGKKQPLVLATAGVILTAAGMVWYVSSQNAPLYWTIILLIPKSLTGGNLAIICFVYCLVAQVPNLQSRTMRYVIIQQASTLGVPLGMTVGGRMFGVYGYWPVYIFSLVCIVLSLVCLLFLKERRTEVEFSCANKMKDFFSTGYVMENFKVVTRSREDIERAELCLLLLAHFIDASIVHGGEELHSLYLMEMYDWSLSNLNLVQTGERVSNSLFLLVAFFILSKKCGVPDIIMGLIGFISTISQATLQALSIHPWMYGVSGFLGVLKSANKIAVLSRLSQLGDETEMGKIFCLVSVIENIAPLLGTFVLTRIYNASIEFFPGLFLAVSAGVLLIPFCSFIWIICYSTYLSAMEERLYRKEDDSCTEQLLASPE